MRWLVFEYVTHIPMTGIMPNRSYWRGFTKYGFIERGKLYAKWTVPLLVAVVWAAPRPYLWEKLSEIFYGEKEE